MKGSKVLFVSAMLAAASIFSLPAEAFDVYRGVDAAANGNARLNPGTFRFNPELSTFSPRVRTGGKCNVRFTVQNLPNNPPQQGDQGDVAGLPQHNGNSYTATFDNVPPGHWSVAQPAGVLAATAQQEVSQWAQANRANVVENGSQANCR